MATEATQKSTEEKTLVEEKMNEDGKDKSKRPVTKEKLRSIMEAASALTALGDEDEESENQEGKKKQDEDDSNDPTDPSSKRYIPEHKKPDAALTFPEKLMTMMKLADKEDTKEYCIAWLDDGKSFVIRNPDEFVKKVLPDYFKATKFSSFTRKLYRWGFRQVNRGIGPDDPIIFGNEYFQRDLPDLMVKMRSITAAGTRKAQTMEQAQHEIEAHRKRPMDMGMNLMEEQRKRMFLEQMLAQQQKFGIPQQDQSAYLQQGGFQQSFNLATALRPSMGGMSMNPQQGAFKNMNPQNFNQNPLNLYMAQQQAHQNVGSVQGGQMQQSPAPPMPLPGQSYNQASTAEIVNAAINALRYAS